MARMTGFSEHQPPGPDAMLPHEAANSPFFLAGMPQLYSVVYPPYGAPTQEGICHDWNKLVILSPSG